MRLVPVPVGVELVVIVLLETLDARTQLRLQAFGQGDLVLEEEGVGLQILAVVGGGAGQRRQWLAVYRVVDIYG